MTEAEWLQGTDPKKLVEFLGDKVSGRKGRLFATGCCRRVLSILKSAPLVEVVRLAEANADGAAEGEQLPQALTRLQKEVNAGQARGTLYQGTMAVIVTLSFPTSSPLFELGLFNLASTVAWDAVPRAVRSEEDWDMPADPNWRRIYNRERGMQAQLFRDTVGNPFRPVTIDPAWLSPKVVELANSIYSTRDFIRLYDLADALVEAGCSDDNVLLPCRSDESHEKGYWVLDLLLGKA